MASRDQIRGLPAPGAAASTSAQGQDGGAVRPEGGGPDDTVPRSLRQKARYENLREQAVEPEKVQKALQAVVAKDGAPGIDRMKAAEREKHLQAHWGKIQAKLRSGA